MRDDRTYLEYLRESIELVRRYTQTGPTVFLSDPMTQDAVLRRTETLADAVARLSDELKSRHSDITWRQIVDFRNILAHAYTEIRLDDVWRTIQRNLPVLKIAVDAELARLNSPTTEPDDYA